MSNAIVLDGWTLRVDHGEPRVRDLDLGERAGLGRHRDVRKAIRSAIEDGAVAHIPAGARESAGGALGERGPENTAKVWSEREPVAGSVDGAQTTEVFYLNEEAALIVLTRLRTKVAVQVTRALVSVFVKVRRGEVALAAAPKAPPVIEIADAEPAGLVAYDRAVAALERAKAEGALDGKGLAVRQAHLLRKHLNVDILSAPLEGFADLPALPPAAAEALANGRRVMMTPVVESAGHYSATAIGRPYGLSAIAVGDIARSLGIFKADGWGKAVPQGRDDGTRFDDAWLYNEAAKEKLAPQLEAERAKRNADAEAKAQRRAEADRKKAEREAKKAAKASVGPALDPVAPGARVEPLFPRPPVGAVVSKGGEA